MRSFKLFGDDILNNKLKLIIITAFGLFLILSLAFHGIQQATKLNHINTMSDKLEELKDDIEYNYFSGINKSVSALAINDCVKEFLKDNSSSNNEHIVHSIDTIKDVTQASIVYVMNISGEVIASTIYGDNNSLIGNNYYFRPYFKEALLGNNSIYPAVGVTTKERGIYFSAPVFDTNKSIIGVVVIKKGLEELDKIISKRSAPTSVVSPEGIVFSSNHEHLYHSLKPLSANKLKEINENKQYADVNITILDFEFTETTVKIDDEEYLFIEKPFNIPNWSIFSIEKENYGFIWLISTNYLVVIFTILLSCFFITTILFYNNIKKLRFTDKELKNSNKKLEDYGKNLEKKINERTEDLSRKNKELSEMNSKLMSAEIKLHKLNENLEKKVLDRTYEVNKLLQQKNEFIYRLSHDLKTPLSPLINLIPVMKRKVEDEKVIEMIDVLDRAVKRMKGLVDKTLELSRIDTNFLTQKKEDINLSEKINQIKNDLILLAHDKNIKINNNINTNLFVKADNLLLDELFINLLSNSVKYSKNENSLININATEDKGFITISIDDDGIGIPSDQLSNIFDEFYKVDKSRHDLSSHGIGLSICKKIVESYGGSIWVKSQGEGNGSTFYFTLPKN